MRHPRTQKHALLPLFSKFILDSAKGKRLQPNGKKVSDGTIKNYKNTARLLERFSCEKGFVLRIRQDRFLNVRETELEKNYWKKFYRKFSEYLYNDLGCYDNYIGQNIKNFKAFFNYLNRETAIKPGNFHKVFYVRKEEIAIFPVMPEELNYLIYDQEFDHFLSKRMKEVKDVFVFGCTVALRVSDLIGLKKTNLRIVNNQYYLAVRSQKTGTDTLIKLPPYCVSIIQKYKRKCERLLPCFNKSNLNAYIKDLLELAGFTHEVRVLRDKRGRPLELKKTSSVSKAYRFCDVASTHTMRRTAITTMLCLGMPEQIVRKISGHAPGTKEFYRYVLWAQTYQDQESEKVFEKLKEKSLTTIQNFATAKDLKKSA